MKDSLSFSLAPLVLGIGCRRGVPLSELEAALEQVMADNACSRDRLAAIASCDIKRDEEGLLALAAALGLKLRCYSIPELSRVEVPRPSETVKAKIGCASVAEAAALLAGGGRLIMEKRKFKSLTMALATIER